MNLFTYLAGFNVACTDAEELRKHVAFIVFVGIIVFGIVVAYAVNRRIRNKQISNSLRRIIKITILAIAIVVIPVFSYVIALFMTPWCSS